MTMLYEPAIVLALFLVRLGIPLAVIVLISLWLKRLDSRWTAEASAYARAQQWETLTASEEPLLTVPCWVQRGCPAERRAQCAASQQPCLPCWLARLRQERSLPTSCANCMIFALPLTVNHTPVGAGDD